MSFDEALAERIRRTLAGRKGVTEKKMFGGIAFMIDGKMFLGVIKSDLMARVGPDQHAAALAEPAARPMDFSGRPMEGYVYVAPPGTKTDAALKKWSERCLAFASALPAKKIKPKPAPGAAKKPAPRKRG